MQAEASADPEEGDGSPSKASGLRWQVAASCAGQATMRCAMQMGIVCEAQGSLPFG